MFICGLCFIYTQPREKATRVVTETREKIYPFRKNANTFMKSEFLDGQRVRGKEEKSDDPGGTGVEIVKEVLACQTCAKAREEANTAVE